MLIALCPRSGAAQPGAPAVTLYGRGLAKLKKGDRDGGNAAAAKAIRADIADNFARYGVK
jgi:hypothetical protein